MNDLTERLEHYAKRAMPHYPNDICSEAKREIEQMREMLAKTLIDPPPTLDEPDTDGEVLVKLRDMVSDFLKQH